MPTLYHGNEDDLMHKMRLARDKNSCPLRNEFLDSENHYFRQHIRDSKILVLGSGLGHDSEELATYNSEVVGIELLTRLALEAGKSKSKNVRYITGNMFRMPFLDKTFDYAVLNMGTMGNFENPKTLLTEMLRVANTAVFDLYVASESRVAMYEQEGWKNVRVEKGSVVSDDGLDSKEFTQSQWNELFEGIEKVVKTSINEFTVMVEASS